MNPVLVAICYTIAAALFLADAFGFDGVRSGRTRLGWSLIPLGLFFWLAPALWNAWAGV